MSINKDLIFGLHSIYHALKNPQRKNSKIIATKEGLLEFKKKYMDLNNFLKEIEIELIDSHEIQERAKKLCIELDVLYQRVPSQLFLLTSEKEIFDPSWLYDKVISGEIKKIICLDQVTDVHNAAAIVRTAAFYNVNALVFSSKGSFGNSPSFNRIASGGNEYISFVRCKTLPKVLLKLQKMGVHCLGFSEHSKGSLDGEYSPVAKCLVFGAEETGMSNSVQRVIENTVALVPEGSIQSLNVSVAAAIAMEKFFPKTNNKS